jgi:hypothetical protein
MLNRPMEERIQIAKKASAAAVLALSIKEHLYKSRYGGEEYRVVSNTLSGAKQRCTNPNAIAYSNYGGRGIEFKFPTLKAAVEWVLDNLGVRPSHTHSIDRVDNNRGYEAGNLRWTTRGEQARNKRVYKRTNNGERIRLLQTQRPDLTYETLRLWITQGVTNEEILQRRKYARTSI